MNDAEKQVDQSDIDIVPLFVVACVQIVRRDRAGKKIRVALIWILQFVTRWRDALVQHVPLFE